MVRGVEVPASMTERVPIKEAAARLGVSTDTVRRRLKSGELAGERQPAPRGFVWLVELPSDVHSTSTPAEMTGAAQAASVLVEDALEAARLRERVDGLERLVGELRGERDAWQAQAERHEDAARELRILVRQAQEVGRLLPGTPGNAHVPEATTGAFQAPDAMPQTRGLTIGLGIWQRLRRLFSNP